MDPTQRITLEALSKGFEKGQKSLCWYVEGTHLNFQRPFGVVDLKTFVLLHKQGTITIGFLGSLDGSLTFFNQKTLSSLSQLRELYPDLFAMEGLLYPMWKDCVLCTQSFLCLALFLNKHLVFLQNAYSYFTFLIILIQHFQLYIY